MVTAWHLNAVPPSCDRIIPPYSVTGWNIDQICHPVMVGLVTRWKNSAICHLVTL